MDVDETNIFDARAESADDIEWLAAVDVTFIYDLTKISEERVCWHSPVVAADVALYLKLFDSSSGFEVPVGCQCLSLGGRMRDDMYL